MTNDVWIVRVAVYKRVREKWPPGGIVFVLRVLVSQMGVWSGVVAEWVLLFDFIAPRPRTFALSPPSPAHGDVERYSAR